MSDHLFAVLLYYYRNIAILRNLIIFLKKGSRYKRNFGLKIKE